jgi:YYY domain-containing protein
MSETLRWWFLLSFVGVLMLPLCQAVFRRLPDRGYALSKPFGLLLLGYVFWLLNTARILPNDMGGIIFALLLLTALSALFAYRERDTLPDWLSDHWRYIAGVEALFFVVFITAVWLRTTVGEIGGTEQPMDLMFLNAATQADHFPPKDPWLSGHTVAYYWFGYLLVAIMGQLASVPTDVAYNIGLGMIAAMALTGAFGIVFSLIHMREQAMAAEGGAVSASMESRRAGRDRPKLAKQPKPPKPSRRRVQAGERGSVATGAIAFDLGKINWRPIVFGLAGALMLVVMGNLVYLLVYASSYGIGGCGLYDWIDISGLACDEQRNSWGGIPYPSDFFGFFGSTRLFPLDDPASGDKFRVITEFPMFSFVLGDLHPHVMALPFVLLVVALALTLFRSPEPLDITFWLERPLLLLASAVLLGGLTFINTWDIATLSFVVLAGAFVANFMRIGRVTLDLFVQVISFALPLVILAFVFYIPFLTSIAGNSQADSFNAVVTNDRITEAGTRPVHAFLFWGPLFAVVLPFVLARLWPARRRIQPLHVALAFAPAIAILVGWAVLFIGMLAVDAANLGTGYGNLFDQLIDRGSAWITALFLAACLAAALLALWVELTSPPIESAPGPDGARPAPRFDAERAAPLFALTLATVGFLLILGCEFFYVGDVFKSRMNTVFKLYYQAWLLLALAGGFSLYYMASRWRFSFPEERPYRLAWAGLAALVLAGAALYPIGGTLNRARPYNEGGLIAIGGQLDGLAHYSEDERAGIAFLEDLAKGQDFVIAEAVGGDYTIHGRISMATGLPAILGWGGHEDQWRGGTSEARAGRFEDVEALYRSGDPDVIQGIIDKYDVSFIYVGPVERDPGKYGPGVTAAFESMNLPVAFSQGAVTIYRTP